MSAICGRHVIGSYTFYEDNSSPWRWSGRQGLLWITPMQKLRVAVHTSMEIPATVIHPEGERKLNILMKEPPPPPIRSKLDGNLEPEEVLRRRFTSNPGLTRCQGIKTK